MVDDNSIFLPENVRKNWKHFTDDQLALAMSIPSASNELIKYIAQMDDRQLRIIVPFMDDNQIKKAIPTLELEKQGVAVQVMNPQQIRRCVSVIPPSDRQILLSNINLLMKECGGTSAEKSDELQSFISFIDPLALAVAVENPSLVDKILDATSLMTPEQIRVIVPLLNLSQIRQVIENIESEECMQIMMEMITSEQKKELQAIVESELSMHEKKREDVFLPQLHKLTTDSIPSLKRGIEAFCEDASFSGNREREFRVLSDQLKKVRHSIEKLQREVRKLQKQLKLPLRLLKKVNNNNNNNNSVEKLFVAYKTLAEQLADISQQLHQQFQILDKGNLKDGLIHSLYSKWQRIKEQWMQQATAQTRQDIEQQCNEKERVFVNEDASVELYEAVKTLGNPAAIGDIYHLTWSDIVELGFRNRTDFASKNITTLKELEDYIATQRQQQQQQQQQSPQPPPHSAASTNNNN
jgi:hypothetical protein